MRTLLPLLLSAFYADNFDRPHFFLDQDAGLTRRFDDLMYPDWSNRFYLPSIFDRPTSLDVFQRNWADILRPKESGLSIITADKKNFQLILDVQNFKKEEIKVKLDKRFVIVEAKHEEKEGDEKMKKMHFIKKYFVPEQVDIEHIKTTLSSDGILMITAPIKQVPEDEKKEILIPIEETGKPAIKENPKQSEETTTAPEKKEPEEITVESVDESIPEK